MSQIHESCHVSMSHVILVSVMSPMNESYRIATSHVTRMNESCHVSMSHIILIKDMSHTSMTGHMTCHILDICDMTHWYMWHDTLIYVTWLFDICGHMTMHTPCYYLWHTPMSHATQIHKLCITNSSKWWVSFAKESYKRDNILQKRPIILRSLLIVASPQANESRHTDEQGMSHVNLLCHVSMSQVTCEFVMSRINKSWRTSRACHN